MSDALPYPDLAALIAFYGDGNFVSGAKITIPYRATRIELERLQQLDAVIARILRTAQNSVAKANHATVHRQLIGELRELCS